MKKLLFISSLAVLMFAISACHDDEPIGKWAPMKWTEPEGLTQLKNEIYLVPTSGGTYTLTCSNYPAPWMCGVTFGDSTIWPGNPYPIYNGQPADNNPYNINWEHLASSWFGARFDMADLTITVAQLPDSIDERMFTLEVTAGDIFDHLAFRQSRM